MLIASSESSVRRAVSKMFTALATVLTIAAGLENGPLVEIDSGLIMGVAREKSAFFKGIPFAAPPIGNNRFRPPQVLNAVTLSCD